MDYLGAGADIVARLQDVPGLLRVYEPADLSVLEAKSLATPCAHVVYLGDRVEDTNQGGAVHVVEQTWAVVLVDKLAAGADTRQAAFGPLLASVITRLIGYKPRLSSPLARINPPGRPWYRNGYGYYPLAFKTTLRLKGDL